MKDEGREAYVSEIGGRFVIPVTPTYKRTVGIVHDSSRTGKTLYVEPTQVCVCVCVRVCPSLYDMIWYDVHLYICFYVYASMIRHPVG